MRSYVMQITDSVCSRFGVLKHDMESSLEITLDSKWPQELPSVPYLRDVTETNLRAMPRWHYGQLVAISVQAPLSMHHSHVETIQPQFNKFCFLSMTEIWMWKWESHKTQNTASANSFKIVTQKIGILANAEKIFSGFFSYINSNVAVI